MLVKPAAVKVSQFLTGYARDNDIYMKINFCNPEHVHTLIDLPPPNQSKKSSSY